MKLDIKHVAKLANLTLSPEEERKLAAQLSDVLEHIDSLKKLDTDEVEPTMQITGLENVLREDVAGESFTQKEALTGAARTYKGMFVVKGIFEDE